MLAVIIVSLCIIVPIFTSKAGDDAVIMIPRNATQQNVVDSVSKYLGREYASKINRIAMFNNDNFSQRHGAYKIEKGMNAVEGFRRLSRGAQYPIKISINGFRLLPTMAEKIAYKFDFSADSLLNVLSDDSIMGSYNLGAGQGLALFLNDSYEAYWNISPKALVKKIGENYRKVWNTSRMDKAKQLGLSPSDIMIIASIVDEETAKEEDKGKIGRLYINRIKKGMKLQADPTVKYAVGDFSLRRIRGEHLKKESPFNTYLHTGLPPAPIKTTSVATIDSILNSKPNDYLYMCAKDDFSGYHAFASTYQDHLKNARAYQRALNKRGIK